MKLLSLCFEKDLLDLQVELARNADNALVIFNGVVRLGEVAVGFENGRMTGVIQDGALVTCAELKAEHEKTTALVDTVDRLKSLGAVEADWQPTRSTQR